MAAVRIVRVFTGAGGRHGNPAGIVADAATTAPGTDHRQTLAAALGHIETVFLDDPDKAQISIYSPRRPVPFAGHAAVGAAWVLARLLGRHPEILHIAAGYAVPTWVDAEGVWVRAPLAITPPWWQERLPGPAHVEELTGPQSPTQDMTQLWAWADEGAGVVRMRTFAARVGIGEDEACGSGAMRLAAALGRPLTIHHGRGSVIHARPGPPGYADIGGHVSEDEPRTL